MPNSARNIFAILLLVCVAAACTATKDEEAAALQVPGVTDTQILIGSSLALGGHASYLGRQTMSGAMAYLKHLNDQGGIHERRIEVIAYDDQYDPPRCLLNTQRLIIEDNVFALFCYVGTPTTVKIIPMVEEARIPLVGMFTGANALREPLHRYIVNVRASYYQETAALVELLVRRMALDKVAVFYQYDAYGFDGLVGTELALKQHGLAPVAKGSYVRGNLRVEDGLEKIMASGAEAVVMIGTYEPCAEFIKMARSRNFNPVFGNVSFVGGAELARRLGDVGEGVIVTQVTPPPETGDKLWGVREYAELLEKYYPGSEPNFVGLEGYLNARVLAEALKRAGRNLNRERFLDAIESIKDYDLGIANTLSFSPTDHQGLEKVYYTRIQNGVLKLIAD